jgi:hypothetical protein
MHTESIYAAIMTSEVRNWNILNEDFKLLIDLAMYKYMYHDIICYG